MKRKKNLRQGTLAPMAVKTPDVLRPLCGYGIVRYDPAQDLACGR